MNGKLKIIRGSQEIIPVLATQEGVDWDLTGYTAVMRVSKNQNQTTPELEISGVLSGTPNNEVVFTITDIQTASLSPHDYHYDILFTKDAVNTISTLGVMGVTNSAKA